MKEIKLREFQEGLYKVKGEDWLVYGRGGEIVGRWTAGVEDAKQEETVEESVEEEFAEQAKSDAKQDLLSKGKSNMEEFLKKAARVEYTEGMEVEWCEKCKGVEAVYLWNGWEEGEEYVDYKLCGKCGFKKPGTKLIE